MPTKKEILEVANEGNWGFLGCGGSELRCTHCGEYDFTGEHKEKCPLGALLKLIEEARPG